MALMLGCNTNIHGIDMKSEALHIPGFQYLNWLLPAHMDIPDIYFLIMAIIMGQPLHSLPTDKKFSYDTINTYLPNATQNKQMSNVPCSEAVVTLLVLARELLHAERNAVPDVLANHTVSIIQV